MGLQASAAKDSVSFFVLFCYDFKVIHKEAIFMWIIDRFFIVIAIILQNLIWSFVPDRRGVYGLSA